jgi:EAL domain-containing protein (putative c-di-GMP-specific phosphodiesterase class I)
MTEGRSEPSDVGPEAPASSVDRDLQILRQRLRAPDEWQPSGRDLLLSETVPGLPSLDVVVEQIAARPWEWRQLALVTVHVSPVTRLERTFGWSTFDRVIARISQLLLLIKRDHLRKEDLLAGLSISGTAFVFALAASRDGKLIDDLALSSLRERLRRQIVQLVTEQFPVELAREFECFIGCAVTDLEGEPNIPRVLHRGLEAAYADAFGQRHRDLQRRQDALRAILEQRRLSVVLQPIVDLVAGKAIAYEALARAADAQFPSPAVLFEVAAECGLLRPLERLCWETAVATLPSLPDDALLFVNVEVESLLDPRSDLAALKPLAGRGVLELTERAAVADYGRFRRALGVVADMGLQVAIDDVGAGHSGLRVLAETRPAFIKLDSALTRTLEGDDLRWELVQLLRKFATRVSAALVVEGVETAHNLRLLRDIGVRYVQGFVFGAPAAAPPAPPDIDLSHLLDAERGVGAGQALDRRLRGVAADLAAVEKEILEGEGSQQVLEEFKLAIDQVRTSVWALFHPADPEAERRVMAHFRLSRMTAMCRSTFADLADGTITSSAPDFEEFYAAVERLLRQAAE